MLVQIEWGQIQRFARKLARQHRCLRRGTEEAPEQCWHQKCLERTLRQVMAEEDVPVGGDHGE